MRQGSLNAAVGRACCARGRLCQCGSGVGWPRVVCVGARAAFPSAFSILSPDVT